MYLDSKRLLASLSIVTAIGLGCSSEPDRKSATEPPPSTPPTTNPTPKPGWQPYEPPAFVPADEQDWTPNPSEPHELAEGFVPARFEGPRLLAARPQIPSEAFVYDGDKKVRVDLAGPLRTNLIEIDRQWTHLAVATPDDEWVVFALTDGSTVTVAADVRALAWTTEGALVGTKTDGTLIGMIPPTFEPTTLAGRVDEAVVPTRAGVLAFEEGDLIYRSADGSIAHTLAENVAVEDIELSPDGNRALYDRRAIYDLESGELMASAPLFFSYVEKDLRRAGYTRDGNLIAWNEADGETIVAEGVDSAAIIRMNDNGVLWSKRPDGPHSVLLTRGTQESLLARGVISGAVHANEALNRVVYQSRLDRLEFIERGEHTTDARYGRFMALDDELETIVVWSAERSEPALMDVTTREITRLETLIDTDVFVWPGDEGYIVAVTGLDTVGRYMELFRGTERGVRVHDVDEQRVDVQGGFAFARTRSGPWLLVAADHPEAIEIAASARFEEISGDWVYYVDQHDVLVAKKLR